jgi:predicted esterase
MHNRTLTRREMLARVAMGAAGVSLGCALGESLEFPPPGDGRLAARPQANAGVPAPGTTPLLIDTGRDGVVYVPPGLPAGPVPLVLMLHGAGGSARPLLDALKPIADDSKCVLLLPDSRGPTWDAIGGEYGDDVPFINTALGHVFAQMPVDPARVAIAGFSDGASYSLGLGLINGDLFTRVIAFSPGFLPPITPTGKPPVFISHGSEDQVLPLDLTSRVIVETLTAEGYAVDFREFAGGHVISAALAREAFALVSGTSLST